MKRRTRRTSLSDWWSRPEGARGETPSPEKPQAHAMGGDSDLESEEKENSVCNSPPRRCFSPAKANVASFCIGDDSDTQSNQCSPRKLAATTPDGRGLMGSPMSPSEVSINAATMTILRGICADYFENNVSPILRFVQQTQEQIMGQLKEVAASVDRKANAEDVTSLGQIEQVAAKFANSRADDSKVAVQIRLEQLASTMSQKANSRDVPTLAQLALKANAKDVPTLAQFEVVEQKADLIGVRTAAQFAELSVAVELKANRDDAPSLAMHGVLEARIRQTEQTNAALREELVELRKGTQIDPEVSKTRTMFAAAGLKMSKQIKEMNQQIQHLQEQCLGKEVGERWPGRKLDSTSVGSVISDNDSDRLSLGASATGSFTSTALSPDEKAEIKKVQTVLAAAGNHFSREMREVKKQLGELRSELSSVTEKLKGGKK